MNTSGGLQRALPPPLPANQPKPHTEINERNILLILINSNNQLLLQGEETNIGELRGKVKEFIQNPRNAATLPEKSEMDIPLIGIMQVTKEHIISLQSDYDTQYQAYISAQNEITGAYNELRDELAQQQFGKPFADLAAAEQQAVRTVYPMHISEAEPRKNGGKH